LRVCPINGILPSFAGYAIGIKRIIMLA